MPLSRLLSLVSRLVAPPQRREAIQLLSNEAGAQDLMIFIPDKEIRTLLPAPGFPQTLARGTEWHAFLAACVEQSPQRGLLCFPDESTRVPALGIRDECGAVLVLLGGDPETAVANYIALLLPLLVAAFHGERAVMIAESNSRMASQSADQSKLLAASLDKARGALRNALSRAETANQSKDRFLAALSHELRTPLTPVLMAAAAMEAEHALPEEIRADIAMIRRNVELEVYLIDDLLDLSRVIAGKMRLRLESLDLNMTVRNAVEVCQSQMQEKGIQLTMELAEDLGEVRADGSRIQQVLWNLLKNAAKFSPENGKIFVRTLRSLGGRVRVEVRDSGIGIEPVALLRIFDAFEQGNENTPREFGGLGLGLAISRAIMDMHQGVISATSEGPGFGATFTVELPGGPATAQVPLEPNTKTVTPGLTARILIAEDHADTAKLLARLLQKTGHSVETVGNVAGALALLSAKKFDLLLSDVGLPDATGYDLMEQAANRYGIPGVAMSGYGTDEDLERSRVAGFKEHLVKPVNIQQLKQAIQRVIAH